MMAPEAEDLIAEIGRLLMTAGDAHYMARQRFNDLRRLLRGQHCAEPAAAQPSGDEPTVEALPRPRPKQAAYTYEGRFVSVGELAAMAGCSRTAMQHRLSVAKLTPEQAVAAGADRRPAANARKLVGKYTLDGVAGLTTRDLANKAGCAVNTMHRRLMTMTPEQAVAAGRSLPRGGAAVKAHAGLRNGKVDAGVVPPAPPARARSVFDVQPTGAAVLAKAHAQQHSPRAFAPDAEVIVPLDVKRTVYQPPTAAAPAPVPSTFGRIGQYEETGTAVSRQYGGSR